MKNRKRFYVLICLVVLMNMLVSTVVFANRTSIVNIINVQMPSVVNEEDNPTLTRMYRIYIENFLNGVISRVDNSGVHVRMGSVLRPATVTKDISAGFWAARYAKANDGTHSAVVGMGVNAMHLRVGPVASYDPFNPTAWTPRGISLHIREDFDHAGGTFSNAGIYTNIPGGTGIFGGWNAAFVGSPVQFLDTDGVWKSLDTYFGGNFTRPIPKRLMIVVSKPSTSNGSPNYIEFENWAAGDNIGGLMMSGNGRVLINYPKAGFARNPIGLPALLHH